MPTVPLEKFQVFLKNSTAPRFLGDFTVDFLRKVNLLKNGPSGHRAIKGPK
jgi:hypothetical protein